MKFPLVILYDNDSFQSGFGAQAIRLLGIYSLCHHYRINYIHSPISEITNRRELTGEDESEPNYQTILSSVRELTRLPDSKEKVKGKQKVIREHNLGFKKLYLLIFLSLLYRLVGMRLIVKLVLPFGIMDRRPELWDIGAMEVRKNLNKLRKGNHRNLVVHYRIGLESPERPQLSSRYYEETLNTLASSGNIETNSIIIHTDLWEMELRTHLHNEGVKDFLRFLNFCQDKFERVSVLYASPIFQTIDDMVTAETLVVSRSALSYFAGIVNSNQVIYPPLHGHAKLPRWLNGSNTPQALMTIS